MIGVMEMAVRVISVKTDLQKLGGVYNLVDKGALMSGENLAHKFVVSVTDGGAPVAVTGTVSAKFVRLTTNAEIALTGAVEDGCAAVTLSSNCYLVPGKFRLTIYVTVDGVKLAVFACVGVVANADGSVVIDPDGEITIDVTDLIADIEAAVATIPPSYTELLAQIADTYSTSGTYAMGEYVWYDGDLYRCVTAIAVGESWTSAHWTQVTAGGELSDLKSASKSLESATANVDLHPDKTDFTGTKAINYTTGSENTTAYRAVTGYINVKGHSRIVYPRINITDETATYGLAFYDESKNIISGSGQSVITGAAKNTITLETIGVPANAVYVRFTSFYAGVASNIYVYDADTYHENDLEKRIDEQELFSSQIVGDVSDMIQYEEMIPTTDYTNGGIKGSDYTNIDTTTTSSYKYAIYDLTDAKYVRIKTRRSNSSNYPSYVFETTAGGGVIKAHEGKASTSSDIATYTFRVTDISAKLYVMVYVGGGSSFVPTVEKIKDLISITNDQDTRINHLSDFVKATNDGIETELIDTARKKVLNIMRTAGKKCLSFAFMTDIHANGYGNTVTYAGPSIDLYVKLCNQKFVDCGIFGGDMYSDYNLSHDEALAEMGKVLKEFGKICHPLFIAKGNHECNGKYIKTWDMEETPLWSTYYYWVVDSTGRGYNSVTAETWDGETQLHYSTGNSESYDSGSKFSADDTIQDYENFTLSNTRNKLLIHNNENDPFGDYFYVDYEDERIRIAILNGFNSSGTNRGLERMIIDTAQLSWIQTEVLNMPSEDWRVLFVTHYHPTENNGEDFYDLIENFINNGGKVLGILHGHQHADTYYTQIPDRDWLVNIIGVRNGYVTDANAIGTKNAYALSVFTIDPTNQKIYETRVGAGSDREYDFEPDTVIPAQWRES